MARCSGAMGNVHTLSIGTADPPIRRFALRSFASPDSLIAESERF